MKVSSTNHRNAWGYFVAIGQIPKDAKPQEWCLHHIDTTLKYTDIDRYNEWRVEDLLPMPMKEHTALHWMDKEAAKARAQKISEARRGKPGHKLTDESKAKISEALKGHEVSEETKQKISEKCKGLHNGREFQKGDEPWNKGMTMSEEFRQKISDLHKGKRLTEEHKRKISEGNVGRRLSRESRAKISAALKGHEVSEEARKKISEKRKGMHFVHSKAHNKKIGNWKRGKIWVNNGVVMKMVDKDDIPEGFTRGRLK